MPMSGHSCFSCEAIVRKAGPRHGVGFTITWKYEWSSRMRAGNVLVCGIAGVARHLGVIGGDGALERVARQGEAYCGRTQHESERGCGVGTGSTIGWCTGRQWAFMWLEARGWFAYLNGGGHARLIKGSLRARIRWRSAILSKRETRTPLRLAQRAELTSCIHGGPEYGHGAPLRAWKSQK